MSFNPGSYVSSATSAVTNAVDNLTGGVLSSVGGLFKDAFPGITNLIGAGFSVDTVTKHISLSLDKTGAGGGVMPEVVDQLGINRLKSPKPPVKNIDKEMSKNKPELQSDVYPPDLSYSKYWIELQFGQYVRPYYGATTFNPSYIVNLPLPAQLSDSQMLGWGQTNFGITGLAANIIQEAGVSSLGNGLLQKVKDSSSMMDRLKDKGIPVAAYATATALSGLTAPLGIDVASAMSSVLGASMNPFPGAYYIGPELRAFQFSWTFIPESSSEMGTLKSILSKIRSKTLSEPMDKMGAFLKYPEICKIVLHPEQLSTMFPIKQCALNGITIDYAPYGLSFHNDQNPTAITLSLVFGEIEPLFKDDFKEFEPETLEERNNTKEMSGVVRAPGANIPPSPSNQNFSPLTNPPSINER